MPSMRRLWIAGSYQSAAWLEEATTTRRRPSSRETR